MDLPRPHRRYSEEDHSEWRVGVLPSHCLMMCSTHPIQFSGPTSEFSYFRPWKLFSRSLHARQRGCVPMSCISKNYFRLRTVRAHSALSLIQSRSKVTSLQSQGIDFSKPILCTRKNASFCAICSHSRWKTFHTSQLGSKILVYSGYAHMYLGETDACSSGQENNSTKGTLFLASVVWPDLQLARDHIRSSLEFETFDLCV